MALTLARFCSLLFVALALAPALAHVMELPHKIGMSAADYLTVQRIYRGWALLGIVVIAALVSTLALVLLVRHEPRAFVPCLIAFLGMLAAQAVFWAFTFPVNRATSNWSMLPDNWMALRAQWEYSHAAGALLSFVSFIALILYVNRVAAQ
ncbi:MAG TPA: DUF1772 domain-containing protein [Casimicrobiaceae bacterium]|jgi:hypothetical protein